jgi:sugar/nucleoside kinase (ribokinase family)
METRAAAAAVYNAASSSSSSSSSSPVVLIVGASGLDRLLTVPCYPPADSKVRTTGYHEVGGGNAANTAHTMARLTKARAFLTTKKNETTTKQQQQETMEETTASHDIVIRLCSKVGDDDIGQKVVQELQMAGVDLSGPLFHVAPGTTTGFTTIIVSATEPHTRTCFYTPGSCGELTVSQARQLLQLSSTTNDDNSSDSDDDTDTRRMNEFFENVVHVHSDARNTDVALFLARQAKQRGICVSVDVEKDRGTVALDQLLQLADIVFTGNGPPVQDYFNRLHCDTAAAAELEHPPPPVLALHNPTEAGEDEITTENKDDEMKTFARALGPSMFFTRWFHQVGKQVVVTQGSRGAMHIVCESIVETSTRSMSFDSTTTAINRLAMLEAQLQQQQQQPYSHECNGKPKQIMRRLQHTFSRRQSSSSSEVTTTTIVATYSIQTSGVLQNIHVVDTTGAGDAFMGAFLLFRIALLQQQQQQDDCYTNHDNIVSPRPTTTTTMQPQQLQNRRRCLLDFAGWVAGHKVQGPGARMALPTARDVDEALGTSLLQIQESLGQLVGEFQF